MRSGLGLILCVFSLLAGCGGGGGGNDSPASRPRPLPAVRRLLRRRPRRSLARPVGTVTETSGATVIVPAGRDRPANTTIRIAMDSTGAPSLPTGLVAAGNTYVVTPHGGDFKQLVEVRIPVPAVTLLPTQQLKIAKAQPSGEWMVLDDTHLRTAS